MTLFAELLELPLPELLELELLPQAATASAAAATAATTAAYRPAGRPNRTRTRRLVVLNVPPRENRVFTGAPRWHTGAATTQVAASVFVHICTLVTVL
ncbi:MAG: hypothetical protein ACLP8S_03170 [Solirubrobacteraceae bacterium]